MSLAAQILLWIWLFGSGFLLTRRLLRSDNPWIVVGASLPVGLLCVGAVFYPLARVFGHPQGWIVGSLVVFVASMVLLARRQDGEFEKIEPFGLSTFQWGCFMSLLTAVNLVMHTRQVSGPGDDYWIRFPLVSLFNRGELSLIHCSWGDFTLSGSQAANYLPAILGWYTGDGLDLLTTLWVYDHLLAISTFFLAFGLGHRVAGTAGGFLMSGFLFFGVSMGSRVGLLDSYDHNSLLVHCLLLLFVAFEVTPKSSRSGEIFLAFALGVFGLIHAPYLLSFLAVIWLGPWCWRRPETRTLKSWKRPLLLSLFSLALAASLVFGAGSGESFDWVFAVGFGWVGAATAALALLGRKPTRPWHTLVVILAILVSAGGLGRLNHTMGEIEKMPPQQKELALRPWYPPARNWILHSPDLQVDEDMLEAALKLRFRSSPGDRMLTDIDLQQGVLRETTVVGLAGLPSAGLDTSPGNLPASLGRSEAWEAFWQTGDPQILSSLNCQWIYSADPEKAKILEGREGLKKLDTFGRVTLWRYEGGFRPGP
ncbi:MAG: hypothetical protein WC314_23760 [Vulcanimicrobiota bacterium]